MQNICIKNGYLKLKFFIKDYYLTEILETILLFTNKWLLFKKNNYLKLYNCMQTNDYYEIEIVTRNHIIISIILEYLKPYNCVQTDDYYWIEIITWNLIIINTR